MNTHKVLSPLRFLLFATGLLAVGSVVGCELENPCGEGNWERRENSCFEVEEAAGGSGGDDGAGGTNSDTAGAAGSAGSGSMDAPAMDVPFGTPCESDADCGGDTAVCVNEPVPIGCTNVECQPGEANEGICPDDWTCFTQAPNPSACVKF